MLHLFDFSSVCVTNVPPNYQRGGTTAVFAFIWFFSTVYFQMCPRLKASACMEAKSSWLHTFTFLHSAFSNVSPNVLPEKMQSHIGCICVTFLCCGFSNVSSNCLPERMHNHIGCIFFIFPYVDWQPFHCNSSARNTHAQDFVPSQPGGKVCPLLLLVLNWESSNENCKEKENESEILFNLKLLKWIWNTLGFCTVWESATRSRWTSQREISFGE